MRHLLAFFALGALLLLAKRGLHERALEQRPRSLTVHVRAAANELEVERAIDEAVLVEEALRVAPLLHDPVVRTHLLAAVLPISGERNEPDEQLLARAFELGMHRADPVVRQRLAFQMEQLLTARLASTPASERELEAFFAVRRASYLRPARVSFVQVALSRARHGDRLGADATQLRERLARERTSDEAALPLGDPTLLPASLDNVSAAAVDARFGPGFADALFRAELATWAGPVASSYGLHVVRVRARAPAREPTLSEVRQQVSADFAEQRRRLEVEQQTRRLRASYRIGLVRQPS
jgi:hypothetical protein